MPDSPQPTPSEHVSANSATYDNLDKFLGQTVEAYCGKYGSVGDDINHCAHFVCHALGLRLPGAALCSNVEGTKYPFEERGKGYCIRVNQVFNSCKNRAFWDGKAESGTCIIVATIPDNIESKSPPIIGQMSKKHIGFHTGGVVYHYSNNDDKVIKQAVDEFGKHYGKDTVLLRADLP